MQLFNQMSENLKNIPFAWMELQGKNSGELQSVIF